MRHFIDLPEDLMIEILLYFKYQELENLSLVSKRLNHICKSYNFWSRKSLTDFRESLPDMRKLYTYIAQKHNYYYESKVPLDVLYNLLKEKNSSLLRYYIEKNNIDYDRLERSYTKYICKWYDDSSYKKKYKFYSKIFKRLIKFICKSDNVNLYKKIKLPDEEFDYQIFKYGPHNILNYLNYKIILDDHQLEKYLTHKNYINSSQLHSVLFNISNTSITDLMLLKTFTIKQENLIKHLKMVEHYQCDVIKSREMFKEINNRTGDAIKSIWRSIIYELLNSTVIVKTYNLKTVADLFTYICKPFEDQILDINELEHPINFKLLLNKDFSSFSIDNTVITKLKSICFGDSAPNKPKLTFLPKVTQSFSYSLPQIPQRFPSSLPQIPQRK